MTRRAAVLLALACCWPAVAAQDRAGDAAKELARLEGAWRVEGLQVGKRVVRLQASDATFTFTGGAFRFGGATGKVSLGPRADPRRIDLVTGKGPGLFGAYRIDGRGTLTLALWTKSADRQGTLDPERQNPPGMVFVLRRLAQKGEVGTGG
jgi:uncharacterized protein (TIGR03067 family)